jgi:hypothetical protein
MTESDQSVSTKRVRDLVAFGKSCSKISFPNPTREGCPDFSTLRAMAYKDRRLSLDDLPISHVVRCSPCFLQYARLRRMSLLVRALQTAAASLIVLATLFAAVRIIWHYAMGRVEPSISRAHRVEPQSPAAAQQAPPTIAPLAITVNLAAFSPTRGAGARKSTNKIHLLPKVLHATFLLPVGMEPGEYALRLEGPAGWVLKDIRTVARLNDGITSLEVDLDLTAVSRGSLSLMIRPPGLSWRTFPVLVE